MDEKGNFDYPIKWKDTQIYTYDELGPAGPKKGAFDLNWSQTTYSVPKNAANPNGIINDNTRNFAKKMTTFNEYWKRNRKTMLGLSHKINFFALWAIYLDPDDPCYSIVVTYPGFDYVYKQESFNDPNNPDCVDFEVEFAVSSNSH